MVRTFRACGLFLSVSAGIVAAQQSAGPPRPAVPAPESVIGWFPCADYKLATYQQIAGYFRALDAASDRMELVEIGQTAEGRTQLLAIISSEANIKKLERYKDVSRRLALARGLTDAQARAFAEEGRAVVWINFGLHSTEVAPAQAAPLMAYRVVSEDTAEMRAIRENVIFLLLPNMNPDGTEAVANWYMKHVGTPYAHFELPELFHKYVGHDNNRDWFMFTQPETRNVGRQLYAEWFPQILYDHHQAPQFPARIFVPPFADPTNPNIPAGVLRGISEMGTAMARRLDREGKSGVISRVDFDTWWNGGMRTAPYFHNMVGILTETQHSSPAPAFYDPKAFPDAFRSGQSTREPSASYPNPHRGGEWHLRDSCEYMITASMAVLDIGAKRRAKWLYEIYRMGRDAIRAGEQELYVIPSDQWDPGTAAKLVNALRWGAIDVERVTTPLTIGQRTYAPGSYVIRGAQPFRAYLTDLLNPQIYPDRRPQGRGLPERPYDITGWTLPLQMGVRVEKIVQKPEARARRPGPGDLAPGTRNQELETTVLEPVDRAAPPPGTVAGRAKFAYTLDPRANDSFTAINRLLEAGDTIYRTGEPVIVAGSHWPPGTFLVRPGPTTHDRVEREARALGLGVAILDAPTDSWVWRLTAPRLGLYHGWGGNIDEGWTRWVLQQFGFQYTSVYDQEMRDGNLWERYDVLVLPDATYERMLNGLPAGRMPPEFTGGMTAAGVANIRSFVEAGGTLIALDTAAELPLTVLDLPVHDIASGQSTANLYGPGSLLRITIDASHPVGYGMPDQAAAFFFNSPVFSMDRTETVQQKPGRRLTQPDAIAVAHYPRDNLLMSGWLLGERLIAGRAAVVHLRVGHGQVVLLGFRAQHRGQAHGTFKLLFNSIYLGGMERVGTVER